MPIRSLVLLTTAVLLGLLVLATPVTAGQRVALVIGNASYAHAPSLANPLNDANDIGAALERLGFAVTRLPNASRAELWDGLQKFRLAASASEVAVVFYAGHGIEVDKRNFLIPVDARFVSDGGRGVRGGVARSGLAGGGRGIELPSDHPRRLS